MALGRLVTRIVRFPNDDAPLLDDAAQMLAADPVDVVGYASTTSAYVVGFDEETAMVSRLSALLDLPVAATCASAVLALRVLNVERVALVGAPWFDPELNELGAAYYRSQGFDVVSSASAELSHDPQRIDPAAVHTWTSRHVGDEAEGVFIGGNGFRAARAIDPLETALGRPVLTANQVLLWNLLAQARAPAEVTGYGRLFAHKLET
jgi:maleate isomerase